MEIEKITDQQEVTEQLEEETEAQETSLADQLAAAQAELEVMKETASKSTEALAEVITAKKADIDVGMLELMPEGLTETAQLAWLNKAEGLQPKGTEEPIKQAITQIGRPTPVTEQHIDQSELTPTQRMSNYFSSRYGGR